MPVILPRARANGALLGLKLRTGSAPSDAANLHRWRKLPSQSNGSSQIDQTPQTRIAELQLENSRLRRLVTDLLLENMKLEEAPQVGERSMSWASRRAFARASTNPLFFEAAEP